MNQALPERRKILKTNFKEDSIIKFAEGKEFKMSHPTFLKDLEDFFVKAIDAGLEGLIIKSLDLNTYYDTKGKTQWLKVNTL